MTPTRASVEEKLRELGLTLPPPPQPLASYVPAVRSGGLLFVSGQLPLDAGRPIATGPVPSGRTIVEAMAAAQRAALNALAIVHGEIDGDWSRLIRIVRLGVFVLSDNGFADQPKVANGASELLRQLFGEAGRHARAAVGVNALPLNATVELEMTVELR